MSPIVRSDAPISPIFQPRKMDKITVSIVPIIQGYRIEEDSLLEIANTIDRGTHH